MILGLGIDLVEVSRIEHALARGERFTKRLFTDREIAYCLRHKEPARHFAARFAAKEAGMKAIGTGWSNGVAWKDFEIHLDPRGRPNLLITGRAAELANAMGATHSVVSLAHDAGLATAVVVLEGEARAEAEAWLTGRAAIGLPETKEVVTELLAEERIRTSTAVPNDLSTDPRPEGSDAESGRRPGEDS